MTIYATGNALGSTDPRDLLDNAQNFDNAVNDVVNDTWVDRFGVTRKTLKGYDSAFEEDQAVRAAAFQTFLEGAGWSSLGAYGAGVVITSHTQTVDYLGQPYSLKPSIPASLDAPYVTTGVWATEGVNFKLVGDNSLRQDLAEPDGSTTIGWEYSQITKAIRTVGEKLSGLELDIWEFAASAVGYAPGGDPATWDWGPCLAAADTRLNAVSMNGGVVRFRQGVYGLGSNAILTGLGKSVIGAGIRATEFRALPGYAGDMITFIGSSYCLARGFKVVGSGGATQRGVYLPYRADSGVTLENRIDAVQVENVAEGFALENPVHCTVSDCRTDRACTLFGIRSQFKAGVGAGQGGTNLRLLGNWFQSHEVTGTSAYINSNTSFSSIGTQFEHGRVGLVLRACPGASVISPLFEDCGMHFSLQGCTNPVFTGVNLDSGTTPDLGIAVQPLIDIDGGDGIKIIGLYSGADDKAYIDGLIRFTNASYGVYPSDVLIDEYTSLGGKGLIGSGSVTRLRIVKDGVMTLQGITMKDMRLQLPILTAPPTSPAIGEDFNCDGVLWNPVGARARVTYSGAGVYAKAHNF